MQVQTSVLKVRKKSGGMPSHQIAFRLLMVFFSAAAIFAIGLFIYNSANKPSVQSAIEPSDSPAPSVFVLPQLSSFKANKTDQFLMDWDVIIGGQPFKGIRANEPHSGAHIQLLNTGEWPKGGTRPDNYPKIYAIADGIVSRITKTLKVGDNDRYGINLAIAKDGDTTYDFEYSIEPMVPEPSPGFYEQFINVKEGDVVTKGQVIAYFYTPLNANGTHIHFELMTAKSGVNMYPAAIFSTAIMDQFYAHWNNWGYDGKTKIPECMGYMISADENPFGTGAVDCLN